MTQGKIMEGVFAINKPTGLSSAQVLRDLQTHFNPSELFAPWVETESKNRERESHNQRGRRKQKKIQVKIGHGGTLDPLATGVLIAGVGKGTKSLQDFLLCTKVYETVVLFGTSTDTYDRVGKVLKRAPYDHITKEKVEEALGQFRGKFMQLPPLFSALKMNGKPLYEYAREGKEIPREIERRSVEVLDLELVEWMEGGTHQHVAPTDEAGYAEINVANKLWKQENVLPPNRRRSRSPSVKKEIEDEKAQSVTEDSLSKGDGIKEEHAVKEETNVEIKEKGGTEEKQLPKVDSKMESVETKETRPDEARVEFEQTKRKLTEDQDDLVHERPASKQQRLAAPEEAVMSGGLAPPTPTPATEQPTPTTPVEGSSSEAPAVKGPPAVRLRMTVTSGFYVRSLCHDLGAAIGSAGLMAELERTRQGDFELNKNVLEYKDLDGGEKVWGPKVEAMLDEWQEKSKPTF
ncbi:related to pseudouridine synthase [Phialocephala subalpina]|uniref:tRNA pseudouridine(55) synthase n=1 Tax=Phialocephala subalpina TaxID=576137 RepID=A0A1L7XJE4_9HELO|nr:related to pseudouridine synthase [Phialocephala subalpina]